MNRRHNILYISYDGLTDPLGKSQIEPYIRGLAKKGFGIVIMTFEKKGVSTPDEINRLKNDLKESGIQWMNLRYHKYPPVFSTFFDVIIGIIAGISIMNKNHIRIIHARSYVSGSIALFLKNIFKANFLFDIRGFYIDERVEAGVWNKEGMLYRVLRRLEKLLFRKADCIISLTDAGKVQIQKLDYMKDKDTAIEVVPTCADLERFMPMPKTASDLAKRYGLEGKRVLIYSGSLRLWRTLDKMLDFFETARRHIPELHFFFITKEKDFFQKRLAGSSRPAAAAVTVTDTDYSCMPEYLSLGSAGIAFYNEEFSKKACCPTKLGEYLASGFPIIVRAGLGDTEKIIKDERIGVVVQDFSAKEYEKAAFELSGLLKEGDVLKDRCVNAAAKHFSLKKGVETYSRVYEDLLR